MIGNERSEKFHVHHGVPQGSCLGPMLFALYTSPLFDVISKHLPMVHCYAGDTQLYLGFQPDDKSSQDTAVAAMEACIKFVRYWMLQDKLKINDEKTEFLLIGTKHQLKKVTSDCSITIGDSTVQKNTEAIRNLGSWFDETFLMSSHVKNTCNAGYYYLHNLNRIRKY